MTTTFASALPHLSHLTALDLSFCHLSSERFSSLSSVFIHLSSLQKLNLSYNDINFANLTMLLPPSLTELNVRGNIAKGSGMVSLCTSIVSLPHLQCLDMSSMRIDDSSLAHFSSTLSHSAFASSLRTLDLSYNNYADAGIELLTSAFPHLPSLQSLSLCSVTAVAFSFLASSLSHLSSLKELELYVSESCSVAALSAGHPSFLDALSRSGALFLFFFTFNFESDRV